MEEMARTANPEEISIDEDDDDEDEKIEGKNVVGVWKREVHECWGES